MRCPTLSELPPPPSGKTGWPWNEETLQIPETRPDGTPWPCISIVTPSYNQGQFIEETIRSVLLQGYPNIEYIVIDGGSNDKSVEIIEKYSPWINYWHSRRDNGQSDAINTGFSLGRGNIFCWINSDDIYLSGTFRKIGECFEDGLNDFITGYYYEASEFCEVNTQLKGIKFPSDFLAVSYEMVRMFPPGVHQTSTFWSRNLWIRTGGFVRGDLEYAMDYELWLRLLKICHNAFLIKQPLALFRRHDGQKTSNYTRYFEEVREINKKYPRTASFLRSIYIPLIFLIKNVEDFYKNRPRLKKICSKILKYPESSMGYQSRR